jgi:alanine racemase
MDVQISSVFNVPRIAIIDSSALAANIEVLGVDSLDISSNAYGHGADTVIQALSHERNFSYTVFRSDELASLRVRWPSIDFRLISEQSEMTVLAYGLRPHATISISPAMTLKAQVLAVKTISAGSGVSYGYTWRAPEDGNLALVALGYADGFIRAWGNQITCQAESGEYRVVGRVAMDAHSISTGSHMLEVGEFVTYFGSAGSQTIFAESVAATVGASPLTVTSNLGQRIHRVAI